MERKNKREPIYIFQCGCEIPESKVERKRMSGLNRTLCGKEEHYGSAWLTKRKGWCIFCGSEFYFKNSGKMPETCENHRRSYNKNRTKKKKAPAQRTYKKPLRGTYCNKLKDCYKKPSPPCDGCEKFEPIFENVDPERFRKLMWG